MSPGPVLVGPLSSSQPLQRCARRSLASVVVSFLPSFLFRLLTCTRSSSRSRTRGTRLLLKTTTENFRWPPNTFRILVNNPAFLMLEEIKERLSDLRLTHFST